RPDRSLKRPPVEAASRAASPPRGTAMPEKEPVSKDVEFIERFGRWLGEVLEKLGESSGGVLRRFLRSRNARLIDRYSAVVKRINAFEPAVEKLTQDEMKAKVTAWKADLKDKPRDAQQAIL